MFCDVVHTPESPPTRQASLLPSAMLLAHIEARSGVCPRWCTAIDVPFGVHADASAPNDKEWDGESPDGEFESAGHGEYGGAGNDDGNAGYGEYGSTGSANACTGSANTCTASARVGFNAFFVGFDAFFVGFDAFFVGFDAFTFLFGFKAFFFFFSSFSSLDTPDLHLRIDSIDCRLPSSTQLSFQEMERLSTSAEHTHTSSTS